MKAIKIPLVHIIGINYKMKIIIKTIKATKYHSFKKKTI